MYGGNTLLQFYTERAGGNFSKIGQYLTKMWTKVSGLLFGLPYTSHSGSGYTAVVSSTTRTVAGTQRPTSMRIPICMSGISSTMQQNSLK